MADQVTEPHTFSRDAPVLGRAAELAQLDTALDSIEQQRSRFLFVGGDPGIGKSRLLEELAGRAQSRRHLVLVGRAAEFERDVPFAVWVDALDAHVGSLDRGRLAKMGIEDSAELAAILPSAGEPAEGGLEDDRYRAHRAVRQLLDGLATRPLVVILDDLHWADDASLELIATLARRPPERGVLVAAAYRPAESLAGLLARLEGAAEGSVATLAPLSDADAQALLPATLSPAERALLIEEAGGNPFYLLQLARSPVAAGQAGLAQVLEGGFTVPAAVTASLAEELAALPDATHRLLRGAAVAGEPFEVSLAAAAAGLDLDEALEAVDDALAVSLVRPTLVPGQFLFRHPLVRRAVYEGAGDGFRLAAHARAADALAERGDSAARAHHIARSAQPGDEEALALLLLAADRHSSRAPASAAAWYGAAARLAQGGPPDRHAYLLKRHARALMAAGRLEQSHAAMIEAQRLETDRGAVEDVLLLAEIEQWLGRPTDAIERLLAVRSRSDANDPATVARILLRLFFVVRWHGDIESALEYGQEGLDAATRAGDPVLLAAVQAQIGEMASHMDTAVARDLLDKATAALSALPNERLADGIEAFYSLGWGCVHLERYEQALQHFSRCLDVARYAEGHRYATTGRAEPAEPLIRLGRVRESLATAADGVDAARLHPSPRFLWWALWLQSAVQLRGGEVEAAASSYEECEEVAAKLEDQPVVHLWMGYQRALMLSVAGEHAAAVAALEAAAGGRDLPFIPMNDRQAAWEVLLLAAIERGDREAGEAVAEESERWAEQSGLRGIAGHAARNRALVELEWGDSEAGALAAARSAAAFEDVGTALDAARSRVIGSRCLVAAGRSADAVPVLLDAEAAFYELGVERFRAQAARELRRLGRRPPARASAPGAEAAGAIATLSPREREIADLVHRQLTNREIAEELFLSEKTVETHLRNIFAKLSVSSRVAVALAMEQAQDGAQVGE